MSVPDNRVGFYLTGRRTLYPQPNGQGLDNIYYYIATRLGDDLFPVAAVVQYGRDIPPQYSGRQIIYSCAGILKVLSDPTNRLAIETERAMATDEAECIHHSGLWKNKVNGLLLNPFPFTMTCALLGASSVILGPRDNQRSYWFGEVDLANLAPIYSTAAAGAGNVFFDITDLDNIRYGINTFGFHSANLSASLPLDPRSSPISASTYALFHLNHHGLYMHDMDTAYQLLKYKNITDKITFRHPGFLDYVQNGWNIFSFPSPFSLVDRCIRVLIKSTENIECFEESLLDRPRLIPGFKTRVRNQLLIYFASLSKHRSVGQLLAVAFEGETRLNWVKLSGAFSAAVLGAALKADALKDATELSFRTDLISGSPKEVVDALSCGPSLRHVYFAQRQSRNDDEDSLAYWKALLKRPELLGRLKITFTGAYSQSLNRVL
ncbi:hypothetical protein F5Y02DRAFT_219117 [Annulohypoxylon stygium]|nr:hypothetical protein F5Y02DRAFT_219117 [Annulohypoxylon stygium]